MTVRAVTFASGSLTLEGALHVAGEAAPRAAVAVCHPHPLYGGDMNNPVVVAICEALASCGIAALRFNFRGTGGSEGSFGGGVAEQDDARAAVELLRTHPLTATRPLGLAGYSFGALVALCAANEPVQALAAVSPPLTMASEQIETRCPALLVFGERDDIAPAAGLAAISPRSFAEQEVVVVPGADHFWSGKADLAAARVADFFCRRLLARPAGD